MALYYGTRGADFVLVASNGGSVGHPLWYRNLVADPRVTVQVKDDAFGAVAHTAEAGERAELWDLMAGIFPTYKRYQAMVEREIPVVVLTRR
ncbi:nitroreductase family deazaflavin-dependent oxidoreductase [Micromonospora sp. CPCC 205371]|nr:nitroreductase family deazaflavin-dependent oxidoreductase [Micromonospora sp. CPCC 205371]